MKKSDMGRTGAEKSDLGHIRLQCEHSLSKPVTEEQAGEQPTQQ